MAKEAELEARFWKALKKDMTMMVGLTGVDETHSRPMTAQMEGDEGGPIWFFSSTETELVQQVGSGAGSRALATFASKGHDLYAAVHGSLTIDNDRAVVDALWNPYVAAWYEGGKDDPKLVLLRLDPDRGQIWLDGSSLLAGIKIMLGYDPKDEYKDSVAKVDLA